jgi:hypothetical protein
MKNLNNIIAITLIATTTILRICNYQEHIYNFVPMAAIGLFSVTFINKRSLALIIPILGQFVTDIYLQTFTNTPGFYPGQIYNYIGLFGAASLGILMKQPKPSTILIYLFGSSSIFFILSNFGFFISGYNGYTINGLTKTYIDAIPFFRNSLTSDMICGILLFTGFFIIQKLTFKIIKYV